MDWGYFDTGALIKRYVEEAGRRKVLQLLRRRRCVTSAVLRVELRSALRRRVGDGTLDEERALEILKRSLVDQAFWTSVDVSREVLAASERLVAAYPLRTLDAIHVASAELFRARAGTGADAVVFVSADRRQTEVAAAIGMNVELIA